MNTTDLYNLRDLLEETMAYLPEDCHENVVFNLEQIQAIIDKNIEDQI